MAQPLANQTDRAAPANPFTARALAALAYANGFTLWHYRALGEHAAPLATVTGRGFFAEADHLIEPGDFVLVSARDGGAMLCAAPGSHMVRVA